MAMLGLFCDPATMVRLPNMICSMMTRDSIKQAFGLGITALQILKFLKMHAHPRILADPSEPVLPDNVEDQICLWDRERKRVKSSLCFKIQCIGQQQYLSIVTYTHLIAAHLYSSEERHLVFVKFENADTVVQYKARLEKRQAGTATAAGARQSGYE